MFEQQPPASITELLQRTTAIAGRSLAELAAQLGRPLPDDLRRHKGLVGQYVEFALGADGGNLPQPDFATLGVELKTIPIDRYGQPLETTYVCVAPLRVTLADHWAHSLLRRKLAQVLWVPVEGERQLPLEDLYTGYRQNVMAPDELLVRTLVPRPTPQEQLRAYKISKRFDDDISAVCLVLNLDIVDGTVQRASIGAGGVAATPARARQTEAALVGQPWTEATAQRAAAVLQAEFSPISDMRASGAYRTVAHDGLLPFLRAQSAPVDLVLAADVFIYVGALDEVFAAVAFVLVAFLSLFFFFDFVGVDFSKRRQAVGV